MATSSGARLGLSLGEVNITTLEDNEHYVTGLVRKALPSRNLLAMSDWSKDDTLRLTNSRRRVDDLTSEIGQMDEDACQFANDVEHLATLRENITTLESEDKFRTIYRDVSFSAFCVMMAHGGLSSDTIQQYGPEIKALVKQCLRSRGEDVPAPQFVPPGHHDNVQDKLEESQKNAVRLEIQIQNTKTEMRRLESRLSRADARAGDDRAETEMLRKENADLRSKIASISSNLEKVRNSENAAANTAAVVIAQQAKLIGSHEYTIASKKATLRSLRSLLDTFATDLTPRGRHWDSLLHSGESASTVAVPSLSSLPCIWHEPWAMEDTQPACGFDELNVHQLCCESIMWLRNQQPPYLTFSRLLMKTASKLHSASSLSGELFGKLARTICRIDFKKQEAAFHIALAFCQIVRILSERLPTAVPPQHWDDFRRGMVQRANEDEGLLLKQLVDGWQNDSWEKVDIWCETDHQDVTVAIVESINAVLLIDTGYMRWVGREAFTSVLPATATIELEDKKIITIKSKSIKCTCLLWDIGRSHKVE